MRFKPAGVFTIVAVFILLCGFLTRDKTLDIQVHDTYFVIGYGSISLILGVLAALTAMVYYVLERFKR